MTKYTESGFFCDFCSFFRRDSLQKKTQCLKLKWFVVEKPNENGLWHACCECGHDFHYLLKKLNILHTFDYQYDNDNVSRIIIL